MDHYAYRILGAHPDGASTTFRVWAPDAASVAVVGDFNDWSGDRDLLERNPDGGLWEKSIKGAAVGHKYKLTVTAANGAVTERADPFATRTEEPPATASIIDDPAHVWRDQEWMRTRATVNAVDAPISIYEVHLGSWGRVFVEGRRFPNYRDLGTALAEHAVAHQFTHVELLPVMEHPFYGSWGYQVSGYFAPTARYGSPEDLMEMIDTLHGAGVGVILDWVPAHFPSDEFALARFDGSALFEYADPREGHHPDWNSSIFNYASEWVRRFLISSALSWLDRYHVDGIRVDGVASMLYRDYSRPDGQWIPNEHGGRENLEAIGFLRELNEAIHNDFPGVATFAEESTSFPGVTRPVEDGGLGFTYKWDMGWMHDTLSYFRRDPVHRRWHQDELSFRAVYAFDENFTLPLSHDEVVHAKGSLFDQMPGDRWRKLANMRTLFGYQWSQPGKKLLFMGSELAPEGDWSHEATLDWTLHDAAENAGVREWIKHLNQIYRSLPALHAGDCDPGGFEWIDYHDRDNSIVAFLRRVPGGWELGDPVLVVVNATPEPHRGYRLGIEGERAWSVLIDSDEARFGGSGWREVNGLGGSEYPSQKVSSHGRSSSIEVDLGPLAVTFFAPVSAKPRELC